ncbi:MAG: peptidoglycan DD-metalloendopeptidase family protein [Thermoanaerobacteraceae bacterium]|nr:peptidoglycan DD-metalloendopeptidase family protein [Thermoanaerobacteraceae bacterium]
MMIVPHSGKSTFSISVSVIALKIFGGLLLAVMVSIIILATNFYFSYTKLKQDTEQLQMVAKDYNVLQQQLQLFLQKTNNLQEKMQELEQLDNDLRGLLKDDPALKQSIDEQGNQSSLPRQLLSSRSGIDRQQAIRLLQLLEQKLPQQEQSLKELKDAVIQRSDRIAHTPSIYPVSGKITSNFGYRKSPFGRRQEFHDGLDIAAPYGTEIVAAADGVVTFTGYKSGYGRTVTISHGYGYETSYCHNSSILVKTGQQVKKGQAIAKVGSSGRSTGPHLHYMVKLNGQLKNPADFLK